MRYKAETKPRVYFEDVSSPPLGHPQTFTTEVDTGLLDKEGRKIIKGPDRIGYIKLGD